MFGYRICETKPVALNGFTLISLEPRAVPGRQKALNECMNEEMTLRVSGWKTE